jgi:thymidylate synthase ThyX
MRNATVIWDEPIVEVLAEMALDVDGVLAMANWVKRYRPECVPEGGFSEPLDLVPHDGFESADGKPICASFGTFSGDESYNVCCRCGRTRAKHDVHTRAVTDNELLCELAGRKCYDSFAEKGAKRTNGEYLASMWSGRIPHRSTGYHAKMTFFFAHVSRRVSHELIRNYVGSDRDEEGSPSQESTRYTEHPGVYIGHPRWADDNRAKSAFTNHAYDNYELYQAYIRVEEDEFLAKHGAPPKGMDRKRIYESASSLLLQSAATSFIWTTNPMALGKFINERDDEAADLEMQRFAKKLRKVCTTRWPNLMRPVLWSKE